MVFGLHRGCSYWAVGLGVLVGFWFLGGIELTLDIVLDQTKNRYHILLDIGLVPIIGRAVEVNGEIRNTQDGSLNVNQLGMERGTIRIGSIRYNDSSRQTQIAIPPSRP